MRRRVVTVHSLSFVLVEKWSLRRSRFWRWFLHEPGTDAFDNSGGAGCRDDADGAGVREGVVGEDRTASTLLGAPAGATFNPWPTPSGTLCSKGELPSSTHNNKRENSSYIACIPPSRRWDTKPCVIRPSPSAVSSRAKVNAGRRPALNAARAKTKVSNSVSPTAANGLCLASGVGSLIIASRVRRILRVAGAAIPWTSGSGGYRRQRAGTWGRIIARLRHRLWPSRPRG